MTLVGHVELTDGELDAIRPGFLGSEFIRRAYVGWPIDKRLYADQLHHPLIDVANDGAACDASLKCIVTAWVTGSGLG